MTPFDPTALGTAAVGCLVGISGAWVALRRDHREARAAALGEAKQTIDLLRQQTEILKGQGEVREAEWRKLEQGWHRREERFEARIGDLERDYRSLVLTVTTMGLCAHAADCPNYDPGDRRRSRPHGPLPPGPEPSED